MLQPIIFELGSTRKYRGKTEWRSCPVIVCKEFDLSLQGEGFIITRLAHAVAEKNCGINRPLVVKRGDTICFNIVPLKTVVFPEDRRPEHLKKRGEKK